MHIHAAIAQPIPASDFGSQQRHATPKGFRPLRPEPNGFPIHLLDRSDTEPLLFRCRNKSSGVLHALQLDPNATKFKTLQRGPNLDKHRPHRLMVRTSRCGRDNPGATPDAVNRKPALHRYTSSPRIAALHMKPPHTSATGSALVAHAGKKHVHTHRATFWHPSRPHRLVVRTSHCGRDNPGSTPGVDICCSGAFSFPS